MTDGCLHGLQIGATKSTLRIKRGMIMTEQIKWDAPAHFVEIDGNPVQPRAAVGMHQMRDGKMLRGAVFHP